MSNNSISPTAIAVRILNDIGDEKIGDWEEVEERINELGTIDDEEKKCTDEEDQFGTALTGCMKKIIKKKGLDQDRYRKFIWKVVQELKGKLGYDTVEIVRNIVILNCRLSRTANAERPTRSRAANVEEWKKYFELIVTMPKYV